MKTINTTGTSILTDDEIQAVGEIVLENVDRSEFEKYLFNSVDIKERATLFILCYRFFLNAHHRLPDSVAGKISSHIAGIESKYLDASKYLLRLRKSGFNRTLIERRLAVLLDSREVVDFVNLFSILTKRKTVFEMSRLRAIQTEGDSGREFKKTFEAPDVMTPAEYNDHLKKYDEDDSEDDEPKGDDGEPDEPSDAGEGQLAESQESPPDAQDDQPAEEPAPQEPTDTQETSSDSQEAEPEKASPEDQEAQESSPKPPESPPVTLESPNHFQDDPIDHAQSPAMPLALETPEPTPEDPTEEEDGPEIPEDIPDNPFPPDSEEDYNPRPGRLPRKLPMPDDFPNLLSSSKSKHD